MKHKDGVSGRVSFDQPAVGSLHIAVETVAEHAAPHVFAQPGADALVVVDLLCGSVDAVSAQSARIRQVLVLSETVFQVPSRNSAMRLPPGFIVTLSPPQRRNSHARN